MTDVCFLCGSSAQIAFGESSRITQVNCPICGHFKYTHEFEISYINNNELQVYSNPIENEKAKIALSNYYRTHDYEKAEVLTTSSFESIINSINFPTSLLDKINLVLEHIYDNSTFFQQEIHINLKDFVLFFCLNQEEFLNILEDLENRQFITTTRNLDGVRNGINLNTSAYNMYKDSIPQRTYLDEVIPVKLQSNGIKHIEEKINKQKSNQCFVAMWFDKTTEKFLEQIMSLEKETDFKFYRVDINKDKNNGWIPDTIIKEIRRSKFMIADLTGYRAGVYYEAGFAEGLGLEVIYTCNKKWFDEQKEEMKIPIKCKKCDSENIFKLDSVHFNLKQRKMIHWEEDKLDDFKIALREKIGALVG